MPTNSNIKTNKNDFTYGKFAEYYDRLGWNLFAHECAHRLKTFIQFRGNGDEKVLDLACGTGELEYIMRHSKLTFTGVDISTGMLSSARKKLPKTTFIIGDMTSIRLNKNFNLVVCFFDSINHLRNLAELTKTFKTAKAHLKPGGFFLFDMLSPNGLAEWEFFDIKRKPDYTVITSGLYDDKNITVDITIEGFIRKNETTYFRFLQKIRERSYPFAKVIDSLSKAGFTNISVSSFNPDQPAETCSRWFFVVS
jgi:ubiquinone/menaquinone biosynthesis C-methylase UbiE